jgi:hypothetical protein
LTGDDLATAKTRSEGLNMLPNHLRATTAFACLAAALLLAGCDQSINYSGLAETTLTGMQCDAQQNQEQNCHAGDVIVAAEGRERLLCDWGWQIVREPGSSSVLCVYRGAPRAARGPAR